MDAYTRDHARRDFETSYSSLLVSAVCSKSQWELIGAIEITDPADDQAEMDFYGWVVRDAYSRIHYFTTDHGKFIQINRADLIALLQKLPQEIKQQRLLDLMTFK